MPHYRIHHLKDHLRQSFRNAPHVSGAANVRPRDYTPGESIDAKTPYAAYFELRGGARPIEPGDLLESESGELRIYKFIGFEEARWLMPEPKVEAQFMGQATASCEAASIPASVE